MSTDKTELAYYFQGKRSLKPCCDVPIFTSKANLYTNGIVRLAQATSVFVSVYRRSFLHFSLSIQPSKSQFSPFIMDNLPIDVNMIVSRQYWNPLCRRNTRSVGIDFLNLSDEQRAEYNEMKIEFSTKINYKTFVMLYKSIKKITDYVIYESIKVYPDDESKPSDQSNELRYNLERQCKMLATKWEPVRLSYSDYVDSD